jgi:hypothetical protein
LEVLGIKQSDIDQEERVFLQLIARNVWKARREGAIVGCLYTVGVLVCLYLAVFQIGIYDPLSLLCYGAVLAIWFDCWRRVFKAP